MRPLLLHPVGSVCRASVCTVESVRSRAHVSRRARAELRLEPVRGHTRAHMRTQSPRVRMCEGRRARARACAHLRCSSPTAARSASRRTRSSALFPRRQWRPVGPHPVRLPAPASASVGFLLLVRPVIERERTSQIVCVLASMHVLKGVSVGGRAYAARQETSALGSPTRARSSIGGGAHT